MIGEYVELVVRHANGDQMTPYERLLGDALRGDAMLFVRQDSVEAAWQVVDPVLAAATRVCEYAAGTWGPSEADRIIAADGGWQNPDSSPQIPSGAKHVTARIRPNGV